MSKQNYLKDLIPEKLNKLNKKPTYKEYLMGFINYLKKPKTIFDFYDRTKLIILLIVIIILLQKVVEIIAD